MKWQNSDSNLKDVNFLWEDLWGLVQRSQTIRKKEYFYLLRDACFLSAAEGRRVRPHVRETALAACKGRVISIAGRAKQVRSAGH